MSGKQEHFWTRTPAQGRILASLRIESCAKRGEIKFTFADGVVMRSALGFNGVTFTSLDGVEQTLRSLDDVWLELLIKPAAGRLVLIEMAEIDDWRGTRGTRGTKEGQGLGQEPIPEAPEAFYDFCVAFDFRIGFRDVTSHAALGEAGRTRGTLV